jgi:hypothetical protein
MPYKTPSVRYIPHVLLIRTNDFRAGLNLRANAFQLQDGESPDLLNVNLDPSGGIATRKSAQIVNSVALTNVPTSIYTHTDGATKQFLVGNGTLTSYSTGANFTDSGKTWASSGLQRAVTFKNPASAASVTYVVNGADAPSRWNGSTFTALTQTFNDNIAAPTNGNMPIAACITSHYGYVWIANTVESATAFTSRVRWSQPNKPEDWRTNDFIDIDVGRDGDVITALVPYRDRLLVFKRNSVWAIYGSSPDTFQVVPVTQKYGAISQEATAATEKGVYFFSWPDGVLHYDGSAVSWLFERLAPAIQNGTIPGAQQAAIAIGWLRQRLYVSIPYSTSATSNTHTLVFDPTLGAKGGWTLQDLPLGPMLEWRQAGAATQYLACGVIDRAASPAAVKRVLKLEQSGVQDNFGSGLVDFTSYYATKWFDASTPPVKKAWKRPTFVVSADNAVAPLVQVFKDFDPTTVARQWLLTVTTPGTGMLWGTGVWGTGRWGTGVASGVEEIIRGGSIGRARAIQVRITSPAPAAQWIISAIDLKYISRRLT